MVRVNLLDPGCLSDQHLIAEYNEILMLVGYVRKFPELEGIPEEFTLGKGHIRFFKNKLGYLSDRHSLIKEEMRKRGFIARVSVDLAGFRKEMCNNWSPAPQDFQLIKERLREKIISKPGYYRYYGEKKPAEFLISLLDM